MRVSNDFFVVGVAGVGTALFLVQLLIVSQQIVSSNRHIQSELAAEKNALPVNWMDAPRRPNPPPLGGLRPISREIIMPPSFEPERRYLRPVLPPLAHPVTRVPPNYPQRALDHNVDGYVEFVFTVAANGSPVNPEVSEEVPQGWGFAEAATALFAKWKFEPEPPDRTVRYRMSFVHPNGEGFLPFSRNHR